MKILIAEDDLTACAILAGLLKKLGHDLTVVNNGQSAWETLLQPDSPQMLILDWEMPGLDGLDVTRLVREHLTERPPYIIFITGRDRKGDISMGLDAGANDYIKKPFDHQELLARVRVGERSIELLNSNIEARRMLAQLAIYDSLTGVFNRRGILEQLAKELARDARKSEQGIGRKLAIGFFDIDKFKFINDQYGHKVGDEVLKGVVALVAGQLRTYDILGRLGGDEFLVISPDSDVENNQALYERLVNTVSLSKIETTNGELSVTLSVGVASSESNEELDKLLDRSDANMYNAKKNGGNQVSFGASKVQGR